LNDNNNSHYDNDGYDNEGYDNEGYDNEIYNNETYNNEQYDNEYDNNAFYNDPYDNLQYDEPSYNEPQKNKPIPNKRPRKQQRSGTAVVLRSFLITTFVVLGFGAGLFALWHTQVQPPPTPSIDVILPIRETPRPQDLSEPAFTAPEPDPADEDILEGLPPFVESDWERRHRFFTFLIMGLDEGMNTDTIMVAGFDELTGRAYVINIPRDTRVDVQRRVRKINAAYPAGRMQGRGHEGGVEQLKREVQTLLGFRPDFYVALDMDVVVMLIDEIGGVEINVPFHMRYDDPYQDLFVDIPQGVQTLDGENAMNFARFRLANQGYRAITDFTRIEHQQQLMAALFRSMIQPSNLLRVRELARLGGELLTTDLELVHLVWFADQFALSPNPTALSTYTLPIAYTRRQGWYEMPCAEGILELVNRTVNPFTTPITSDMLRIAP